MDELSSVSEICVAYALLTVGTNPDESKIMRLRCADAAREMGHPITANQIEESLDLVKRIEDYSRRVGA